MSPAVLKRCSLSTLYRPTIRIRYDNAIRPNTNRLFGLLFGTEANTNRIFGTFVIWNSLPNQVVDVNSIDLIKTRLDNFWSCQDVLFDWTADLAGIGDQSE